MPAAHCRSALHHLKLESFFQRVIFAQELGMEKGPEMEKGLEPEMEMAQELGMELGPGPEMATEREQHWNQTQVPQAFE